MNSQNKAPNRCVNFGFKKNNHLIIKNRILIDKPTTMKPIRLVGEKSKSNNGPNVIMTEANNINLSEHSIPIQCEYLLSKAYPQIRANKITIKTINNLS
jgi:hypothetical protein